VTYLDSVFVLRRSLCNDAVQIEFVVGWLVGWQTTLCELYYAGS
jgi:hypothetical protein